jgi:alpha-beta hydrolase superfamily lysophospholipase
MRPAALVRPALPIVRLPMYFGPPGRRAFGWYHAPPVGTTPTGAVVICPPLGFEYINTHRSLRHLADRLAWAGVAALRFDYYGTGDSAGTDDEPGQVAAWIESVHDAMAALREASNREIVALAGLRMGALLAAAAASRTRASSLVLWAPCPQGRTFLRELRALDLTSRPRRHKDRPNSAFEAAGFIATDEIQRDLTHLSLDTMTPLANRVLLAARDDLPESSIWVERWRAAGLPVDRQPVGGYAEMIVAPHNTTMPFAAIDAIVAWVADAESAVETPQSPRLASVTGPWTTRDDALMFGAIRETPFRFGDTRPGFGVLTEPTGPADQSRPAIVMSNAGSAHHVGPNRLHVRLCRALARAGFRCVRFDFPGLGDSVIEDIDRENVPYPPDASQTVGQVLSALSKSAATKRFVLMGLCSGAHTAFHAALDLDEMNINEAILINPLTYSYTPGLPLDAPSQPPAARWHHYLRSIGALRQWLKLFRADDGLSATARDLSGVLRAKFEALARRRDRAGAAAEGSELASNLERLAARHRGVTLVFSEFDPGYDLLMADAAATVRSLRKQGKLRVWFVKDANHIFDAKGPRTELIATITRSLRERYPSMRDSRTEQVVLRKSG